MSKHDKRSAARAVRHERIDYHALAHELDCEYCKSPRCSWPNAKVCAEEDVYYRASIEEVFDIVREERRRFDDFPLFLDYDDDDFPLYEEAYP